MSSFLKKIRFLEAFLMTGFVMISVVFSDGPHLPQRLFPCVTLFLGTIALLISIYAINSYYGFFNDQSNARFLNKQFSARSSYLLIALVALLLSLGILASIDIRLISLSVGNFILWSLYSGPNGAKSLPVVGTLIHFLAQIILFQFGFIAFAHVSSESLLISIFFAILFSGGHLIHELKDYEPDRKCAIKTNAVMYGPDSVIFFYKISVLGLLGYWLLLFLVGIVPLVLFVPFFLANLSHLFVTFYWSRNSLLTPEGNKRFQTLYRAQYFCAGVASFLVFCLP
jgi:4-hydroxybenzoate polyprenyltransferase